MKKSVDLRSSKHNGSLVVEIGFSTLLIDLFIENWNRLKKSRIKSNVFLWKSLICCRCPLIRKPLIHDIFLLYLQGRVRVPDRRKHGRNRYFFRLIENGFKFCKKSIMVKMLTTIVFKALFKCWNCNGILAADYSILWCVNPLTIFLGWQVKLWIWS